MIREADLVSALKLDIIVPSATGELPINEANICRPGLQLTGYWDFFAFERPQLFGKVEMAYLDTLDEATLGARLNTFFSFALPCVIVCRGHSIPPIMLELAKKRSIPVYRTNEITVKLEMDIINYLRDALAPSITMHGVLVDVYGVGLLITGKSGVGKSESALELVKRGHRMVADDAVELRRLSENELVGSAPEMTKNLMELRGIGVVDVKALYGVQSVKDEMTVSMVIRLKYMEREEHFDRLGSSNEYVEYLGNRLPCFTVPVSPGRNVAVIVETAAVNFRQKRMGYDAMEELQRRLEKKMQENNKW